LSDPFGTSRLTRSEATTPEGRQRLANDISRAVIGIPFTRKAQDEIREIRSERQRLCPALIDKNAYRQRVRKYVPYERRSRRRRGWRRCELVLPARLLEGLKVLAKTKAQELASQRLEEPYGYKRRYPKTVSRLVTEAINHLLIEYGFSEFCVED
jgi:hypothetical protein